MKKVTLLLTATALLLSHKINAQITPTAIAEMGISASSNVTKTCNDSRLIATSAGVAPLNVVGWDGSTPAFFYSLPALSLSGIIALPAGATAPDMVLSANASNANVYLLLVYRVGSSFIFDRRQWTGTWGTPVTTVIGDIAGSFLPNTSIDASKNGDYAIQVTRSNGQIIVLDGSNASLPGAPTLSNALPAGTGHQTDICLNSVPSSGLPTNIHLTYTDQPKSKLFTQLAPFSTLVFGGGIGIAGGAANNYLDPHIASPVTNAPSCPATDVFSIIYNDQSASTARGMHLYSQEATAGTTNVNLTSAGAGFPSPATTTARKPALSYNQKFSWVGPNTCSSGLTTGWEAGINSGFPSSLYGEKLLSNGTITAGITYYQITPPSVFTRARIAISSKYTNDNILISYWDTVSTKIIYKFFSYAAATLRKSGTAMAEPVKDLVLYPNPSGGNVYVNIENIRPDASINIVATNITGKAVYAHSSDAGSIQADINSWFSTTATGIYFVKFADNDGFTKTIKLIKQ